MEPLPFIWSWTPERNLSRRSTSKAQPVMHDFKRYSPTVASGKQPSDARLNCGGPTSHLPSGRSMSSVTTRSADSKLPQTHLAMFHLLIWWMWPPQYEVSTTGSRVQQLESSSGLLSHMALCKLFNHSGSWFLFRANIEIKCDYT